MDNMSEWQSGQPILAEYMIEKELGRGGMGRVWLVRSQSTGRKFAVKQALIRDEKHRKAFLGELQTWIDLPEHPNIVPCRFFRTVGDEVVIFADYIEGGSLAEWIAKGKLTSLEQILAVAIRFARGLHAIHQCGLIHQDVKPGNVLMSPEGVPKVTDFGLARARDIDREQVYDAPISDQGQAQLLLSFRGMTPAYASPEQRDGNPLTCKTDIWSWGVSLMELFTGEVSWVSGAAAAEVLDEYEANGPPRIHLPLMPPYLRHMLRRVFVKDVAHRSVNFSRIIEELGSHFHTMTGRRVPRDTDASLPTAAQKEKEAIRHLKRVPNLLLSIDAAYDTAWLLKEANDTAGALAAFTRCIDLCNSHTLERHGSMIHENALLERGILYLSCGNAVRADADYQAVLDLIDHVYAADLDTTPDALALRAKALLNRATLKAEQDLWAEAAQVLEDDCLPAFEELWTVHSYPSVQLDIVRALLNLSTIHGEMQSVGPALNWAHEALMEARTLCTDDADAVVLLGGAHKALAAAFLKCGDHEKTLHHYDCAIRVLGESVRRWGHYDAVRDFGDVLFNKAVLHVAQSNNGESARALVRCIDHYRWAVDLRGMRQMRGDLAWAQIVRCLWVQSTMSNSESVSKGQDITKELNAAVELAEEAAKSDGRKDIASLLERNMLRIQMALLGASGSAK